MKLLEALQDFAVGEDIEVRYCCRQTPTKGSCMVTEGGSIVMLNQYAIDNSAEELCTFAEELGHIETGTILPVAYYLNPTYKRWVKRKNEIRAKRWAIDMLLPVEQIQNAIEYGCRNDYEAADYCGVDIAFLNDAIKYYQRKGIEF